MRALSRKDIDLAVEVVSSDIVKNFPPLRPDRDWIRSSLCEAISAKNNCLMISGENYIFAVAQSVGWSERKIVSINHWSGNPFLMRATVRWWRKRRGLKALTIQIDPSKRVDDFMRALGFGKAMGLYIMYHDEV